MAPEQGRQETPPQKLSIIKISNFILFPFSSDVFRLKAGTVQQAIDSGYAMITTDIPANKFGKYGTVSAIEEVPSPRPDSKRKHIKITGKFRARITKTESPPAKEGEILPQFIFAEWKKLEDSPVGDEIWHSPDFQSKLNEFRNLVTANLTAIRTITMNNHDESLQALFQETLDIAANIGQNNFSESLDKISSVFNMSPNISLDASNFSYDYLRKLAETLAEIQPMARLEMLIELAQKDDNILKKILETKKVIDEGRGQTGLNHPLQQIYNEKKDKISEEARRVIEHGLEQLNNINPQSAEYEKLDTYLDWLVKYPWGETGKDNEDINKIARTLDEDHYGLPQPKLRIKEFIAAKSLNPELESPILLFVGPPGTGKTSLGKSIARALDRKFVRMSVGGIHDESEIRGFPKTYVGSKPGRFVREIRRAETLHLVFMIDEEDKLYGGGAQGSAQDSFLEVLDPEQYRNFVDNYMEVGIDLSPILFICTANVTDKIPPALLNRMEVIYFSSYSEDEKTHIARKFLIPKQLQKNGLTPDSKMFRQDNEARFEPVKIDISDSVISKNATSSGTLAKSTVSGHAYADRISGSTITLNAYYLTSIATSTVSGSSFPGTPAPADLPVIPLPISDSDIDAWETIAEGEGTYTGPCPYLVDDETINLGPLKINCDLLVQNDGIIILNGPVWVVGDITLQNDAIAKLPVSYGSNSEVLIADNPSNRTTSSKIVVKNNAQTLGSGTNGSYIISISQNNSAELGGTEVAVQPQNNATNTVFYAAHGKILLENNVGLKEATAYIIHAKNNSVLNYETGLQNLSFSQGPSGGYTVEAWKEVE